MKKEAKTKILTTEHTAENKQVFNPKLPNTTKELSKTELCELIRKLNGQKLELEKENEKLRYINTALQSVANDWDELPDLLPSGHLVLPKEKKIDSPHPEKIKKLKALTEHLPNIVFEVNKQGQILYAGSFAHFHIPNFTGKYVQDWVSPIYQDKIDKLLHSVFNDASCQSLQFRWLSKRSEIKWYQSQASPIIISGLVQSAVVVTTDITDLVMEKERQLSILDNAIDGFCITDLNGKLIKINDSYCRMSKYTKQELLTMRISDLEYIESANEIDMRMKYLIEYGEHQFETRHRRKDGTIFDVEVRVQYYPIDGGQFVAFIHDITERKLTEETLRVREQKFRNYIDFAPHGIFVANPSGAYTEVNSAATKITGYSREELLSMNLYELVPEDSLKEAADHFSHVVNNGFAVGEFDFNRKDGSRGCWSVDAVKLSDHSFLGFVVDISERKKAEKELWQSENLLKTVMDLLPIGVWILNKRGEIISGNSAGQKIWAGKSLPEINDFDKYNRWWLKNGKTFDPQEWSDSGAFLKREVISEEEVEIVCLDKTHKIILTSAVPLFNDDGGIRGAIVTNQDISERKKIEKALVENEHLFRVSQSAARIGSYTIDLIAGTASASSGIYEIFGIDETNTNISQVWDLLIQLDANVNFFDRVKRMEINRKISFDHEYKIVRQNDGVPCWVHRLGELEFNEEQRPIKLVGTIQDITAHKQAEEAIFKLNNELETRVKNRTSELLRANAYLRQAEEKYRTVADYTYGWEFWTDIKGDFLYCSPSCERITGYHPSEFNHNPQLLQDIIHPSDLKLFSCHKQKEAKGREGNLELNYRIIRKDGSIRWIGHVCQPILNEDGILIGTRGSNRDITERKNIEKQLKTSNQKYKLLSENITDGIFICRNGIFEYVNKGMNDIFGYNGNELIGANLSQLAMPDYLDELEAFYFSKDQTNKNKRIDIECIKKDYSEISVEFLFNFIAGEQIIYGVAHDISEKKQSQKNIVKAIIQTEENERAYFSKELHDGLGPLLSTIKLYLQWSERAKTNERREEIIQQAEVILEDALTTVREISNKLSPHLLTNYGLSSAIQSFVQKIEKSSGLMVVFDSDLKRRLGDEIEAAIYRATIECINNTIKHAKATTISIRLNDSDNQLLLHYHDNGIGFDLEETLSVKKGLGLFNLQNRIQTIGGKITMYSKPGFGVDYKIIVNL
jgi:PAS domain S-box-containing protein